MRAQFADVAQEVMADERGVDASRVNAGAGSSSKKKKRRSSIGDEGDDNDDDGDAGSSKKSETKLLENLLGGKSGVMSAMNHDNIVDGGSYGTTVDSMSRAEADRIAKRASRALRSSQLHR